MPKLLFSENDHAELTYSDAFLVPNNPILDRLRSCSTEREMEKLESLHKESRRARRSSRKYIDSHNDHADPQLQLLALDAHKAFRNFALELAAKYPDVARDVSRDFVDFTPADGFGNTPIVVANMNNVAGKRMAEITAMTGGSTAIPQDKPDAEMRGIGEYMHNRDVRYMTPIAVSPRTKVYELRKLLEKRDMNTAVVTEDGTEHGKFVGLVRIQEEDEKDVDVGIIPRDKNGDAEVDGFIRRNPITKQEGIEYEEAVLFMDQQRTHILPILTADGHVKGVITKKGGSMRWRYKPHTDDVHGGLAMLATVGALNRNPVDRVKLLLDIGVSGIVFDTAHFDQGIATYKNVQAAADIIANSRQKVKLIAGNMVTEEAVMDTFAAGADIAKVGIGPGAMCSTRMETGVGRPQLTAVLKTARAAKEMGKHVWADGGIQYPRDVALALAAGASQVMIGSLLASTYESPTEFQHDGDALFKTNNGMASRKEAQGRTAQKLERDLQTIFREQVGLRSEGISGAKVYQREGLESVTDMIHWIMDGVTSAMTYMGARNLLEYSRFAQIGVQNSSGFAEGQPRSKV